MLTNFVCVLLQSVSPNRGCRCWMQHGMHLSWFYTKYACVFIQRRYCCRCFQCLQYEDQTFLVIQTRSIDRKMKRLWFRGNGIRTVFEECEQNWLQLRHHIRPLPVNDEATLTFAGGKSRDLMRDGKKNGMTADGREMGYTLDRWAQRIRTTAKKLHG